MCDTRKTSDDYAKRYTISQENSGCMGWIGLRESRRTSVDLYCWRCMDKEGC